MLPTRESGCKGTKNSSQFIVHSSQLLNGLTIFNEKRHIYNCELIRTGILLRS